MHSFTETIKIDVTLVNEKDYWPVKEMLSGRKNKVTIMMSFSSVQFSSVTQSCPTLCDPIDSNPPGSSVHGIFQARGLECAVTTNNHGIPVMIVQRLFLEPSLSARRLTFMTSFNPNSSCTRLVLSSLIFLIRTLQL